MNIERVAAAITYWIAVCLAWLGDWSLQDVGTVFGMALGAGALLISWYYRRKTYQLLEAGKISREVYEHVNR
ncbi:HP1 family phage holin [Enterobacter sp.]|uniref:HP1 family phage holin n=1 Tax=Enterobacter sp. TaxID=42895 RepID=UPI00296EB505|nr:HP1 family phage holin [Enterobacter sp.]